jgi:hypothetical protein
VEHLWADFFEPALDNTVGVYHRADGRRPWEVGAHTGLRQNGTRTVPH